MDTNKQVILSPEGRVATAGMISMSDITPTQLVEALGISNATDSAAYARLTYSEERDTMLPKVIGVAERMLAPWIRVQDLSGFYGLTALQLSRSCGLSPQKVIDLLQKYPEKSQVDVGGESFILAILEDDADKKPSGSKRRDKAKNYESRGPRGGVVMKSRPVPGKKARLEKQALIYQTRIGLIASSELVNAENTEVKTPKKIYNDVLGSYALYFEKVPDKSITKVINTIYQKVEAEFKKYENYEAVTDEDRVKVVAFITISSVILGELLESDSYVSSVTKAYIEKSSIDVTVLDCLRWLYTDSGASVIPNMEDAESIYNNKRVVYPGKDDILELREQSQLVALGQYLGLPVNLTVLYADTDVTYTEMMMTESLESGIRMYVEAVRAKSKELNIDLQAESVIGYVKSLNLFQDFESKVTSISQDIYRAYIANDELSLRGWGLSVESMSSEIMRFNETFAKSPGYTESFLDRYPGDEKVVSRIAIQNAVEVLLMELLTQKSDLLIIPTKSGRLWETTKRATSRLSAPTVAASKYKRRKIEYNL